MISETVKFFLARVAGQASDSTNVDAMIFTSTAEKAAEIARLEGALEMLEFIKPYILGADGITADKRYIEGKKNLKKYLEELEKKYHFKFPVPS